MREICISCNGDIKHTIIQARKQGMTASILAVTKYCRDIPKIYNKGDEIVGVARKFPYIQEIIKRTEAPRVVIYYWLNKNRINLKDLRAEVEEGKNEMITRKERKYFEKRINIAVRLKRLLYGESILESFAQLERLGKTGYNSQKILNYLEKGYNLDRIVFYAKKHCKLEKIIGILDREFVRKINIDEIKMAI